MPESGVRIDEQAALDVIHQVEDVAGYERLKPPGSVPTPDWRVTLADGRLADVEVILDTDAAARSVRSQFSDATVDPSTGKTRHAAKEWPDPRLSYVWDVWVSDHNPSMNGRRSARELVEALIPVLRTAENTGRTTSEMAAIAQDKLIDPGAYFNSGVWAGAWQKAARSSISFESWLQTWASESGYWYPELLLDHHDDWTTARRVRVAMPPRPIQHGSGRAVTHLSIGESAFGECQALLDAIARSIEKKTAKRQMDGAPDLRWLAVMLDGNAAAWQLNDIFGRDAQVASPDFGDITLEYFDEVWVVAKAPHEDSYVLLRLFKSGVEPRSAIVPRS